MSLCMNNQTILAANNTIKVLDIETNSVVKEAEAAEDIDKEVEKAIKSIQRVTVQANPVPKKGYLIKIPLTKAIKVKSKWFNDIVSEALLIYNPATKNKGIIILYTDENTPLFFDIDYDFSPLLKKINKES